MDTALLLLAILVAALVWRGPRTLPQIGAMLGRGVRQARRQLDGRGADDARGATGGHDGSADRSGQAGRSGDDGAESR